MNIAKNIRRTLAALVCALAGFFARNIGAETAWTASSCAPADWMALDDNLLVGETGSISGAIATGYSTNDPDLLTDASVPMTGGADRIVGFQNTASITWTFAAPKTLERVRVSCGYLAGASYSGFTVSAVEVQAFGSSAWTAVNATAGQMAATSQADILSLELADGSGVPLAEGVGALRVMFGTPPTGFANYCAEIEAVGFAEATGPVLGAFVVTPAKTRARVGGSIADPGTEATACDIYLSLDNAEAVKVAEGVSGAFEYLVQGLTAGTAYAYELSVSNNAPTARGTVRSGTFTTLPADAQTMAWTTDDVAPGDWTALAGNLLAGRTGTIGGAIATGYSTNDPDLLTDAFVPTTGGNAHRVGFQNNASIEWAFDEPETLERIRVSACYLDGSTYTRLAITAVSVKLADSDTWDALGVEALSDIGGRSQNVVLCASLSDSETGCLSRRVVGLKIAFGNVGALASYCVEIEAVGHASADDPVPPEFAAPSVDILSATRAAVSASLSDLGGRATRASVCFAYGTSPDALGASECLAASAAAGMAYGKTLTGLAPETTYYYAFFATNDVTDVGATVTGSFTTPVAATVACALEIPAGVSVKAGGLTYTASTTFQMPKGDEVVFEAVPAAGYKFLYWEGAVSGIVGMSNPLAFASEEACTLKPVVAPDLPPATFVWRGGDGDWADGANWDVGRVPTSGDAVVIASGTCSASNWVCVGSIALSGTGRLNIGMDARDGVDEVGGVIAGDITLSDSSRLDVALPNGNRRGRLKVGGDLALSDSAELHVAAGPVDGREFTLARGCGFVAVGGTFAITGSAKFVPCCDQYTGGGVVTTAERFALAAGASVEAVSLGYAWFADRDPNSCAPGSPTGTKGNSGWYGSSYGGQGDTYGGGTGIRGNGGIEPYGFSNAPVHPGSHKYNDQQKNNDPTAGGGNVRVHAARVALAGTIDVTTEAVRTSGAPSGGGIWITASKRLDVGATARLLAKGGNSAQKFGNGNGGGGRIAFGLRLEEEELSVLAATGELPAGSKAVIGGEEEFLAAYPGTTISLEGGQAANEPDEPLEVCRGTFRFLVGPKTPGLVIQLR